MVTLPCGEERIDELEVASYVQENEMSRRKSASTGFIYRVVRTATHIATGERREERFGVLPEDFQKQL